MLDCMHYYHYHYYHYYHYYDWHGIVVEHVLRWRVPWCEARLAWLPARNKNASSFLYFVLLRPCARCAHCTLHKHGNIFADEWQRSSRSDTTDDRDQLYIKFPFNALKDKTTDMQVTLT